MRLKKHITFSIIGLILLSGCGEKRFSLQSYADKYFNDPKQVEASAENNSDDTVHETTSDTDSEQIEEVSKDEDEHFTLQKFYEEHIKDKNPSQTDGDKTEPNYERLNRMPVIGK